MLRMDPCCDRNRERTEANSQRCVECRRPRRATEARVLVPDVRPEPDGADHPRSEPPRSAYLIRRRGSCKRRGDKTGGEVQHAHEQHGPEPPLPIPDRTSVGHRVAQCARPCTSCRRSAAPRPARHCSAPRWCHAVYQPTQLHVPPDFSLTDSGWTRQPRGLREPRAGPARDGDASFTLLGLRVRKPYSQRVMADMSVSLRDHEKVRHGLSQIA